MNSQSGLRWSLCRPPVLSHGNVLKRTPQGSRITDFVILSGYGTLRAYRLYRGDRHEHWMVLRKGAGPARIRRKRRAPRGRDLPPREAPDFEPVPDAHSDPHQLQLFDRMESR